MNIFCVEGYIYILFQDLFLNVLTSVPSQTQTSDYHKDKVKGRIVNVFLNAKFFVNKPISDVQIISNLLHYCSITVDSMVTKRLKRPPIMLWKTIYCTHLFILLMRVLCK